MPILNAETLGIDLEEVKHRQGPPPWGVQVVLTDHVVGTLICQSPGHPNDRHYHIKDEWWVVLEGEIEWEVEGAAERVHARPGTFVFVPRNRFHHIHVVGDRPAIRLAVSFPGEPHRHERPT
jgi:quercetin dioxygenase-like cupin family protein